MAKEATTGNKLFINFTLANKEFCVDIIQIKEILEMQEITEIPNSPPCVRGVLYLRGTVIPVIDLKKRFKITDNSAIPVKPKLIVVDDNEKLIAMVVDSVSKVITLEPNCIQKAPSMALAIDCEFVAGVGKIEDKLIVILDLKKVLTIDDKNFIESSLT
jgi:purine-binding chemotaxis protein CheW